MTATKKMHDAHPKALPPLQRRRLLNAWSGLRWLIVLGWVVVIGIQAPAPLGSAIDFSRSVVGLLGMRTWGVLGVVGLMLLVTVIWLNLRHPSALRPLLCAELLLAVVVSAYGMQSLTALLYAFYVLIVAGAVGLLVFRLLGRADDPPMEQFVLSLVFGLGILAILVLGAGMAGSLHRPRVLIGSTVLTIGCVFIARRSLGIWAEKVKTSVYSRNRLSWFTIGCLSVLSVFFIFNLLNALAPEVGFDALKSHLALAKIYATENRVSGLPYSLGSYWPLGGDLLFTLGYQLGGETTAKLIHFIVGALAAGTAYLLGARLHSSETGIAAATVFYTMPVISWETGTAYTDLFLAMYAGASMILFLKWIHTQDWPASVGLGLVLGFAFGIKPTAAFVALGIGLAMLYPAVRLSAKTRVRALMMVLGVTGVTSLVGGIWYLRAYWLTGNPVFPFFNHLFRSPYWFPVNERFNFGVFGVGHSIPALIKAFWLLSFKSSLFGEVFDGAAGLALILLLPLFCLFVRLARPVALLLFIGGLLLLEWLIDVQYLRYLITVIPLLAAIGGWTVIAVWKQMEVAGKRIAAIVPGIFFAIVLANLPFTIHERWYLTTAAPWDILSGKVTREKYRQRITTSASTFNYINSHLPTKQTTLFSVGEYFQYLSDAVLLTPGFTMEGEQLLRSGTEAELMEALRRSGISYVVVNRSTITDDVTRQYPGILAFKDDFYQKHARLIYAYNNVYFYRLLYEDLSCPKETWRELMQNPGMEEFSGLALKSWDKVGKPIIIAQPGAIAGERSVRVTPADSISQQVMVQEEKLYGFAATVKSATNDSARANMQIQWLGDGNVPIDHVIEVKDVDSAQNRYSLSVTAPLGARAAMVTLSVYSGSAIYDDVTFQARTSGENCP